MLFFRSTMTEGVGSTTYHSRGKNSPSPQASSNFLDQPPSYCECVCVSAQTFTNQFVRPERERDRETSTKEKAGEWRACRYTGATTETETSAPTSLWQAPAEEANNVETHRLSSHIATGVYTLLFSCGLYCPVFLFLNFVQQMPQWQIPVPVLFRPEIVCRSYLSSPWVRGCLFSVITKLRSIIFK